MDAVHRKAYYEKHFFLNKGIYAGIEIISFLEGSLEIVSNDYTGEVRFYFLFGDFLYLFTFLIMCLYYAFILKMYIH